MKYKIAISEQKFEIEINEIKEGIARVNVNGEPFEVLIENYHEVAPGPAPLQMAPTRVAAPAAPVATAAAAPKVSAPARAAAPAAVAPPRPAAVAAPAPKRAVGKGEIIAPIPGRILDIKVQAGDQVNAGQTVAIMEAMKMENNIVSPVAGTVQEIRVQKDSQVAFGQIIMVIA